MSAVWVRMGAELRGRWRAWLGLALVMGLFGGAIIAAAAGARRTDSVYPRFLKTQHAFDIGIPLGFSDPCCASFTLEQIAKLPLVSTVSLASEFFLGEAGVLASPDPRAGRTINAYKVLEGRMPDPARPDEVIAPFDLARQKRWGVGTVFRHSVMPHSKAPPIDLRIVGIGASPGDFPPYLGNTPGLFGTPALYARYEPYARNYVNSFEIAILTLRHGNADLDAFHRELDKAGGGKVVAFTLEPRDQTRNVVRSFHLQAVALWLVAALAALSALLVFSQTLAREMFLESTEYPTLRSLGFTESDLVRLGMARAAAVAGAAAVIATIVAVGSSPLFPTGLPRVAEPHPGASFDAAAIGIGAAAILVLVCLLAAIPARRTARLGGSVLGVAELSNARPSATVAAMARAGFPPSAVAGVRLAIEPGRGRTSVPVRTTILGVTLGIAALAAAVSFSSSLAYLLRTPRLYGQNWDASFQANNQRSKIAADVFLPTLRGDKRVEAVGIGTVALAVQVGPLRVGAIVLDDVVGKVTPIVRSGRDPIGDNEILLGQRTLHALHKQIGDTVQFSVQGAAQRPIKIVGTGIIPPVGQTASLGEGAALHYGALKRLCQCDVPPPDTVVVRFAPGVAHKATVDDLNALLEKKAGAAGLNLSSPEKPTDLVNFGRVQGFPLILAGLLGALAAAVLAHALITVIRRRRRDLAILKTLGFLRGQVRRTVVWQATTLALIAFAIGLPLGIGFGRWLWTVFANQLGIIPAPRVPVPTVLLAIPAGVLFANLIAARPAVNAARTRPALVLRTE